MARFTLLEASKELNISKGTMRRLVENNNIGFIQEAIGAPIYFTEKHLESYNKRHEVLPNYLEEIKDKLLKGGIQEMAVQVGRKKQSGAKTWNFGIGKILIKGTQYAKDEKGKKYPSYYVRYYRDGKRIMEKAKGAFSLHEALTYLIEAVKKVNNGNHINKNEISLKDFWNTKEKEATVDDVKAYKYSISHFFDENLLLSEISVITIDEYVTWMKDRGNAPKTINERLKAIRKILNLAQERKFKLCNDENPVKKSHFQKVIKNRKVAILAEEDDFELLRNCELHVRPIVEVAINSGMRLNEIIGLKWSEVIFANGYSGIRLPAERTKDRTERFIPFSLLPELQELFIKLRNKRAQINDNEFESKEDGKYVFLYHKPYKNGMKKWIHPTMIRRSFTNSLEKAGLKGQITFHSLRHTFITRKVKEGKIPVLVLNIITGHDCTKMTEHYTHLSEKDLFDICKTAQIGTQTGTEKISGFSEMPSLYGEM